MKKRENVKTKNGSGKIRDSLLQHSRWQLLQGLYTQLLVFEPALQINHSISNNALFDNEG